MSHFSIRLTLTALYAAVLMLVSVCATQARAQETTFYALVVHGGDGSRASYADGVLRVQFHHSPHPAGSPNNYERQVPPGTASWPDRTMKPDEPTMLTQHVSRDAAVHVINALRQGGYWTFWCHNDGRGNFDVHNSEPAYASVRID